MDVHDATKIRSDYIRNMEDGNFDYDLPDIYRRGFLRLYAKYLGLDESAVMADYLAFAGAEKEAESERAHKTKEQFLGEIVSDSKRERAAAPEDGYSEGSAESPKVRLDVSALKKSTFFKAGAVIAIVVMAIVALVWGLQKLTQPPAAEGGSEPAVVVEEKKALEISITALKDTSFKIAEENGAALFEGEIYKGQTKSFASDAPLIFSPKNMEIADFKIERNGTQINTAALAKTQNYRFKIPQER